MNNATFKFIVGLLALGSFYLFALGNPAGGGLVLILFAFAMTIQIGGGWPEGWYRIRRIPYFAHVEMQPDQRFKTSIYPQELITRHSPAIYETPKGSYFWEEKKVFRNKHNAPSIMHLWGNANAIDVYGTGTSFNADFIKKGYRHTQETFRREAQANAGHVKGSTIIIILFLLLILSVAGLAAYYSYNTTCAVHSMACMGGK